MPQPLRLFERSFAARAPAYDVALSRALLADVAGAGALPALRLHQPGAALAFSALDRAQPGFAAAASHARAAGFAPTLRLAGGRAAVFHEHTIAFAWCTRDETPRANIAARFAFMAEVVREALCALGVDARVGAVPGEYCPGAHSVNARGERKLMGVGQRIVRAAAHTGGVVVVREAARVREVLAPVYEALGFAWRPQSVGAVEDEVPGVTREDVLAALLAAFARRTQLAPAEFSPALLRAAAEYEPQYTVG